MCKKRITPYSCRLIHAGPIHADLFMPDRFVPSMTDWCPYLFMPGTIHAPCDLFMPEPIHAQTDSCPENPQKISMDYSCPCLFMPRTIHAQYDRFMSTFSTQVLFMPMLIHVWNTYSCPSTDLFMPVMRLIHAWTYSCQRFLNEKKTYIFLT